MLKGIRFRINKEARAALAAMESGHRSVFLTGRAGTGKSTLLSHFRETTKKRLAVLAPTGVAALNVRGQTIHSFFGFHPEIRKERVHRASEDRLELFRKLDTIVIDEISMVRADLLDCVDRALRLNRDQMSRPFGGVQMIFVGDLYQLPPVVPRADEAAMRQSYASPYFFSAHVLRELEFDVFELKKVYRQKDRDFIELLNRVRTRSVTEADVRTWNRRHDPEFDPAAGGESAVHLTATNEMAQRRNDYELRRLESEPWTLEASASGSIGARQMPSDPVIEVKLGARLMFTTNDPERRWVNGTLGTLRRIRHDAGESHPTLEVDLEDGETVEVGRHTWEVFEYRLGKSGKVEEEVVGTYTQHPVMLAWAVTIHKSQGKTFDRVLVDVGRGAFAHGQMYVALSRCRSFDGITLLREFRERDVIVDLAVVEFMDGPGGRK